MRDYRIVEEIGVTSRVMAYRVEVFSKSFFSKKYDWNQAYEKRYSLRSNYKVPVKFDDVRNAQRWVDSKTENKIVTVVFSTQNPKFTRDNSYIEFAKWLQDNYSTNTEEGGTKPLPKGTWRKDFTNDHYDIEEIFEEWKK